MRLQRKKEERSHASVALLHCGNFPIPDRNNRLLLPLKAAHSSSQRSFIGLTTLLLPVVSQDQEPGAPPPAPGFFLFPLSISCGSARHRCRWYQARLMFPGSGSIKPTDPPCPSTGCGISAGADRRRSTTFGAGRGCRPNKIPVCNHSRSDISE
jgi:hypothetical protein